MLCPQLVFIEGRMSHYKEVGMQIREIFHRYTDLVEPISIDEAYLDVTNNKMEIALGVDVAKRIKADIRNELHLVASAGVSYNKFLAKVASDWRKPDGLCTIHPSRAQHFIEQLPIKAFWGVGPVTEEKFLKMGVKTGADLLKMPLAELVSHIGQKGVSASAPALPDLLLVFSGSRPLARRREPGSSLVRTDIPRQPAGQQTESQHRQTGGPCHVRPVPPQRRQFHGRAPRRRP